MRDIVTNEGLNIMLNEIVDHEMDKTLNNMISTVKEWQKSTDVVYPETIIDLIKSQINNKESKSPAQGLDISKIWIFEIQDAICGGIIIADSEEEALKKLALDRKLEPAVMKCCTVIFPLNSLDLNNHVHDLW